MPRLLLSLLAMLALVVQSASTFAFAGTRDDAHCCCPSKEICKCHEHDGSSDANMKRCGGGEHEVLPELAVSTVVEPPATVEVEVAAVDIEYVLPSFETIPGNAPEKPPF